MWFLYFVRLERYGVGTTVERNRWHWIVYLDLLYSIRFQSYKKISANIGFAATVVSIPKFSQTKKK